MLVCRDAARGEAARAAAAAASGGDARVELADLASQASIRDLAGRLHQRHDRLDVLVNNAGTFVGRRTLGPDGIELTFALNHLGYFLLTNLVLDLLEAAAPSRIVNVASAAHTSGKIDLANLRGGHRYSAQRAYASSKLANLLFTYELARRLEGSGVTVNAVHPGTVRSRFGNQAGPLVRLGVRIAGPFMLTPERGADTVVWLASSPEVEGVSGRYFIKRRARRSSPASRDREVGGQLWDQSATLTGMA